MCNQHVVNVLDKFWGVSETVIRKVCPMVISWNFSVGPQTGPVLLGNGTRFHLKFSWESVYFHESKGGCFYRFKLLRKVTGLILPDSQIS